MRTQLLGIPIDTGLDAGHLLADNDRFADGAKADDDLTVVVVRRR